MSGSKKRLKSTTPFTPRASSESATAKRLVKRIESFTETGTRTAEATLPAISA